MKTKKMIEKKLNQASNTVKAAHEKMNDMLHPLTPDARADTPRARSGVLEKVPDLVAALEHTGLHLADVDVRAMQANAEHAEALVPLANALRCWLDDVEDTILHSSGLAWRDVLVVYRVLAGLAETDAAVNKLLAPMTEEFRAGQTRKTKARATAANDDQPVKADVDKPTGT